MKEIRNEPQLKKDIDLFVSFISPYEIYPIADIYEVTDNGINLSKMIFSQIDVENMSARLSNEGYTIQRMEFQKPGGFKYCQFTDKGRKLKELGSIDAFYQWVKENKEKEDRLQEENDILRKTNILSGKIQQNLLAINRWIALAGIVAALYYLIEIIDYYSVLISKKYALYYGSAVTIYLFGLGMSIGACITLLIMWMKKQMQRKKAKLSTRELKLNP